MAGRSAVAGWARSACVFFLFTLTGCAGKTTLAPLFYPPKPDLPRVQFLRSVKDYSDVVEAKSVNFLKVGEKGSEKIPVVKPYGIAVQNGKIYLTDTIPAEVDIIDLKAKSISRLAGNKATGRLKKPIGIAVHEDGTVYVADTSRLEVLMYDANGDYVRSLGKELDIKPVDVKTEGKFLYVLDNGQSRLLVLDRMTGALIRTIGQEGPVFERLALPMALSADGHGNLYVTNINGRIIEFDRDGHFLKSFGTLGQNLSEFGRPRGIAADGDGLLYIVDTAAQNTRIFDDQFHILMEFAGPGDRASLNVPSMVAVSKDKADLAFYQQMADPDFALQEVVFVVSQFGDNKIGIFGLGKKRGIDYDAEYRSIAQSIEQQEKEIKAHKKDEREKQGGKEAPAAVPK